MYYKIQYTDIEGTVREYPTNCVYRFKHEAERKKAELRMKGIPVRVIQRSFNPSGRYMIIDPKEPFLF